MPGRNGFAYDGIDLPIVPINFKQASVVDAVGQKRRLRADAQPASQADASLEIVDHGEFMITGQADALEAGRCSLRPDDRAPARRRGPGRYNRPA